MATDSVIVKQIEGRITDQIWRDVHDEVVLLQRRAEDRATKLCEKYFSSQEGTVEGLLLQAADDYSESKIEQIVGILSRNSMRKLGDRLYQLGMEKQ
jgi:hypothetical protein